MEMMVLVLCRSSYTLHLLAYKWGSQRIRWVGLLSSNELSNQNGSTFHWWKTVWLGSSCAPEFILDNTYIHDAWQVYLCLICILQLWNSRIHPKIWWFPLVKSCVPGSAKTQYALNLDCERTLPRPWLCGSQKNISVQQFDISTSSNWWEGNEI